MYKSLSDEELTKYLKDGDVPDSTGGFISLKVIIEQARRANRLAEAVAAWAYTPMIEMPTSGTGPGTAASVELALATYRGDE